MGCTFPSEKLMSGTCSCKATSAFSLAPGMTSVAPTPKGLSVRVRMRRMLCLVCSGDSGLPTTEGGRESEAIRG
eukprot:scaffold24_cov245-Pinguiococcus_pyrenoidosus.AAC.23